MSKVPLAFAEQYMTALQSYVAGGREEALECAYELGRQALADGCGVMDMAATYHQSLNTILQQMATLEEGRHWLATAAKFFVESLSPFEMAERGYLESSRQLRQVNEALARHARELKHSNVQLASTLDEHKRAEEQIRKLNAELEQANRELESFSYSVSHDLRAPLRSIDGFSQALLEDYADQLDVAAVSSLQRVRGASQRMAQLIDDLLELSRVSRGEMRRDMVDLSALAGAVAADLQRAEPERAADWAIAGGVTAPGDGRLLRIALENLLGNAWKFTGKCAHARIEFGVTEPADRPGTSAYYVRDNGSGFDMAYADKLFGAFQRLHTASDFPGTGIGLATVQRIISRHGGQIWAQSAVDQGATFYFTL